MDQEEKAKTLNKHTIEENTLSSRDYKYGFVTEIETDRIPAGLSEDDRQDRETYYGFPRKNPVAEIQKLLKDTAPPLAPRAAVYKHLLAMYRGFLRLLATKYGEASG